MNSETGSGRQRAPEAALWRAVIARPYLSLLLLTLLLTLPGLTGVPPLDRDESRIAEATAEMLERGDYIRIEYRGEPRHKKPVGIHWLQAVSVSLLSDVEARAIWAYRMPSFLGAMLAVMLTFWGGRRLFDDPTAFIGASLLAGSLLVAAEATIAKTDAALLAAVTASLMAAGRLYMDFAEGAGASAFRPPGALALLVWVALGVGILIKGPVAPVVFALTVFTVASADGRWAWLRRLSALPGFVILIALVLPWSVAVWKATDGAFFRDALSIDMAPKLAGGQESHGAPPGVYTLLSPLLLWPASLLLFPAVVTSWRERARAPVRFCLAWLVPMWLVFELTPTKLPHYVLPLLPPAALLSAHALRQLGASGDFWPRALSAGLWFLVTLGMAAGLASAPSLLSGTVSTPLVAAGLAMTLAAGVATAAIVRCRPLLALSTSLAAALILSWSAFQIFIPGAAALQVSPKAAAAIAAHRVDRAPIAVAGYAEPSIVFLLGADTELVVGPAAGRLLAADPDALALVEQREEKAFRRTLAELDVVPRALATVTGLNYSRGQWVELTLYGREQSGGAP